jgi:hypothetical protein
MLKVQTNINFPRARFVAWRKGWVLPARFGGTVDDDSCPYLVEVELAVREGRVECTAVRFVQRDDGPPVTPRRLRGTKEEPVPLTAYIKAVVANTAFVADAASGAMSCSLVPDDELAAVVREVGDEARKGGRRPKERSHLEAVAKVYSEAKAAGRNARQAVESDSRWGPVAASTAARWIRAAKDADIIKEKGKRR